MTNHRIPNVKGYDRLARGVVGATMISWALNGHPIGWLGLLPMASAIWEYCPIYALTRR